MVNKFLLSVFYTGITSFSVIVTNLQLFGKMSKLFSTFFSTRAFLGKLFFERRGCGAILNSAYGTFHNDALGHRDAINDSKNCHNNHCII